MPAIPQPPVVMPKQITYPNVVIDVQPLPDGNQMLVISEPAGAPHTVHLFPMPAEYAEALGRKLTAPHIIPAASSGSGPPPKG